jgi:LysR family glycine cleavage system transcriptional activator
MSRNFLPLNALRAFEAAGRHLSFTRAAKELGVTQAAVSHQVKGLEDRIGMRLFIRTNRALMLTEAGDSVLPVLSAAFDSMDAGLRRIGREGRQDILTVTAMPSFTVRWLIPRLYMFRESHPGIDVRISTEDRPADFVNEDFDLGIRYGPGNWPGLEAVPLMTEDIFPVCSPSLLRGCRALKRPADLRHHQLVHDNFSITWHMWLMSAGIGDLDYMRGPSFTDTSMALEYAAEGRGVALGRTHIVQAELESGRLVKPFDISLPTNFRYYIIYPAANSILPRVQAFRDWLLQAARAEAAHETASAA